MPAGGGHGERVVSGGTGGPGEHGGMVQVQYNRVAGVPGGHLVQPPAEGAGGGGPTGGRHLGARSEHGDSGQLTPADALEADFMISSSRVRRMSTETIFGPKYS